MCGWLPLSLLSGLLYIIFFHHSALLLLFLSFCSASALRFISLCTFAKSHATHPLFFPLFLKVNSPWQGLSSCCLYRMSCTSECCCPTRPLGNCSLYFLKSPWISPLNFIDLYYCSFHFSSMMHSIQGFYFHIQSQEKTATPTLTPSFLSHKWRTYIRFLRSTDFYLVESNTGFFIWWSLAIQDFV